MANFLRDNWIWIVAPIVVVFVLMLVLIFFQGGDESSPFIYTIF